VRVPGELTFPPPLAEGEEPPPEPAEGDPPREDATVPRICFSKATKYFMLGSGMDRLKEMAEEEEPIRADFNRNLKPVVEDGLVQPEWKDQNVQKYKSCIWISVSDFMTPGNKRALGKSELVNCRSEPARAPEPPEKGKVAAPKQLEQEESGEDMEERLHGVVYEEAGTYLKLPVLLERPVVPPIPKPRKASLAPHNVIQGRPPLHRFKMVEESDQEVADMLGKTVALLVAEYKNLYPGVPDANSSMEADFTNALTTSGKYHTFKEVLKKSVIRLVREKFQRDGNETPEEVGMFYDTLFVYLMEKVNDCLKHAFDDKEDEHHTEHGKAEKPPEVGTVEAYVRMAEEAEINLNMTLAGKYRQECIIMKDKDASLWLEYALFALRNHDQTKAEECLRESIALDSNNPRSLLAYAVLLFMSSSYEEADIFFDVVLDLEPTNAVCWAMRGLVYDQTNRPDDALQAYAASRRTQEDAEEAAGQDKAPKSAFLIDPEALTLEGRLGPGAPLLMAATFLLDIHATSLAEKALTVCQVHAGAAPDAFNTLAKLYMMREDYVSAEENLEAALKIIPTNKEAWTIRAHVLFVQGKEYEALSAYKKVLEISSTPLDNAVYLRYGQILLNTGKQENISLAKNIFLKACISWPCSSSWLGVAISCYLLGENDVAENALVEANIADNTNGLVWAYTTLVCLRLDRVAEADHAFQLALRLGIDRRGVLVELAQAYHALEKHDNAEPVLRRALAMQEDMSMREMLASTCKALGDHEGAAEENIVLLGLVSGDDAKVPLLKEIVKLLKESGDTSREKDMKKYQKQYKTITGK